MFHTEMLSAESNDLIKAAELIKQGEVVGFPTETVYGLAGNALDPEAVAKIFAAKGRPADNPLIVHLADFSGITEYAEDIPDSAYKLAEIFCPGPITMVVKKKDIIPDITSGGLDTVGIRVPVHKTAREFIRLCGVPIAAPSANLSGSPSPTSADHVFADMNGRIPAIIDGGYCPVGVESTVVSFEGNAVRILRPGFVSGEDIKKAGFEVLYAKGVTEKIDEGERVLSPGMKYKHYAPKAEVTIVDGDLEQFTEYVKKHYKAGTYSMIFDDDVLTFPYPYITYGNTAEEHARMLFGVLREADEIGAKQVFARCPSTEGVGLAVYNRLLRAAAFRVEKL